MMLQNKVAVIYGAGGAIAGAATRAFASGGARVFLTGGKRALVEAIAKESYPLADPPRRRRSTLSTNKLSTSIYGS